MEQITDFCHTRIMTPGVDHRVYTYDGCVARGRHFLHYDALDETIRVARAQLTGESWTNQNLPVVLVDLCMMAIALGCPNYTQQMGFGKHDIHQSPVSRPDADLAILLLYDMAEPEAVRNYAITLSEGLAGHQLLFDNLHDTGDSGGDLKQGPQVAKAFLELLQPTLRTLDTILGRPVGSTDGPDVIPTDDRSTV